jgi:hypothetical protein
MDVFIAVYLIACVHAADRGTCTKIYVTDNTQVQADGAPITMLGCMGREGAVTAKRFWDEHQDMHAKFEFGGWACCIGNKPENRKGQA